MSTKIINRGRGGGGTDEKIRDKNLLVAGGGVLVEETAGHERETEGETYRV